ncbi:N-acyl-D-amino-acid deacylase family protein [Alteromonas sediminis]|nr:D-aminoacylase [Alteromonas sediminis]
MRRVISLLWCLLLVSCVNTKQIDYDTLILNGMILDGAGTKAYQSDLAIVGDTIVAIGDLQNKAAQTIVDANGKYVTPGFIDLHSHAERGILRNPDVPNIVRQGVTTILGGNCGGSPTQVADYFSALEKAGSAINVGLLIGHNSVRRAVMQRENRPATDIELHEMKKLVNDAMKEGAFGFSTGLLYIPGVYASTHEVIALASQAANYGGIYATHMRSEGEHVIEALNEAVKVAEDAVLPLHVSHHKTAGPNAWGLSKKTLAIIDEKRAKGLDVSLDQYPYTASNTNLGVLLPPWSLEGGRRAFAERVKDIAIRQQIKDESAQIIFEQRAGDDLDRILISQFGANPEWEGQTFKDVLVSKGVEPSASNAADLAIDIQLAGGGRGIYFTMTDEDVERIMQHPMTSIASDGRATEWQKGNPHPRNYGTYPRVVAHYVNEKRVLQLEDAVRKMTSLPAERINLQDRGRLSVGMKADVLIWELERLQDISTFENPHAYSEGIDYMWVNGQSVIFENELTGNRPGQGLRHESQ